MSICFKRSSVIFSLRRTWFVLLIQGMMFVCITLAPAFGQASLIGVGTNPSAIGINPLTNKIFVANESDNNVTVIDGASNTTTVADKNAKAPIAIAVNPFTGKVYVANSDSNNISVFGPELDRNATTVTDVNAKNPGAISVNPVTNRIYVANFLSNNVTVIDGNNDNVIATVQDPNAVFTGAVAVNPVTNKIYAVNSDSGNVTVIDGVNNSVLATVDVGTDPQAIAVNPITNKIYVINRVDGTMTVLDGNSNVPNTIEVGAQPVALAVNPATNKIYVANKGDSQTPATITVIDGASNTIADGLSLGPAEALAVNVLANEIYATIRNSVTVINGVTDKTMISVPLEDAFATAIGVNPITQEIYVLSPALNEVFVVNAPANGSGIQPIPLMTAITVPGGQAVLGVSFNFSFAVNDSYLPITPPVQGVFCQVDTLQGTWAQAVPTDDTRRNFIGAWGKLALGPHTVYAFAVDGQFADSIQTRQQSSPIPGKIASYTFNVVPAPTTTTLSIVPNPAPLGTETSVTVRVSSPFGTPTGTVNVRYAGGNPVFLTPLTLVNGVATVALGDFAAGEFFLIAEYSSDNGQFAPSSSQPFTWVIVPTAGVATTTTLNLTGLSGPLRRSVTFEVVVKESNGRLENTGTIILLDGNQQLGPPLSPGQLNKIVFYTTPLTIGAHNIRAVFMGGTDSLNQPMAGSFSDPPVAVQTSPRPRPTGE